MVVACEVIYDTKNHEPILNVLSRMLAPGGVCWIGDPCRSQAPKFYELARRRGFEVVVRNEEGRVVLFPVETGLQIIELRRV